MRTIHKYPLKMTNVAIAEMPRDAKVIAVEEQTGTLCLWAEVDDSESMMVPQAFRVVGTGHQLCGDEGRHIGSAALVWHVYELLVDTAKGARCLVCGNRVNVPDDMQMYEWTCERCQQEGKK